MLQWLPLPTLTSRIPQLLTMDNMATLPVESARMKWSTSPHASSLNSRPTWVASTEALPSIRVSPLSRLLKLSSSRTTVSVSFSSNSALCLTTKMHAVDSLTIAPPTLSSRTWTSASDRSARSPLWSLYMTSKRLQISTAQTPRISLSLIFINSCHISKLKSKSILFIIELSVLRKILVSINFLPASVPKVYCEHFVTCLFRNMTAVVFKGQIGSDLVWYRIEIFLGEDKWELVTFIF